MMTVKEVSSLKAKLSIIIIITLLLFIIFPLSNAFARDSDSDKASYSNALPFEEIKFDLHSFFRPEIDDEVIVDLIRLFFDEADAIFGKR